MAVAFAKVRVFVGKRTIIVQGRAPEEAGVGHHAGGDGPGFGGVTADWAAGFGGDAQITGISKLDVFGGLLQPRGVDTCGHGGMLREGPVVGLDVGLFLQGVVISGAGRGAWRNGYGGIAAVAVGAAEMHGFRRMHGWFIGGGMAGDAARGFPGGLFLRLSSKESSRLLGGKRGSEHSQSGQDEEKGDRPDKEHGTLRATAHSPSPDVRHRFGLSPHSRNPKT